VNIVDDSGGLYHVSGHANRPDLETVHRVLNPEIVIPMHGEHRHLREHARIAMASGRMSDVVTNGMMIDLTKDAPEVAEYIEAGRTYLDGSVMIGSRDGVVRDRIRMALNGHIMVTLLLDEADEPLGDAWVEVKGLPEKGRTGSVLADVLEADLTEFVDKAGRKVLKDDDKLDEAVRRVIRQICMEEIGKKPEVTVVVSRLSDG
jgi:ribonuclease J